VFDVQCTVNIDVQKLTPRYSGINKLPVSYSGDEVITVLQSGAKTNLLVPVGVPT
jgi:hypothetical protein